MMNDVTSFEKEFLNAHNEFRAMHGTPSLTLNRSMCTYAKEWAEHLCKRNILEHRSANKYGENLYLTTAVNLNAKCAVTTWYNEFVNYKSSKPGFAMNTGHFTQVVWKSSRELGVGIATDGRRTWVVANYNPPGNVFGQYAQNVAAKRYYNMASNFNKEVLDAHNKLRADHGCPPLKITAELNKFAEEWANNLASKNKLEHRDNNAYGENIYYAEGMDIKGDHPVKMWYKEIEKYNFSDPKFSPQTGHFTQLIWKDTKEVGVGIAKRDNKTYVVCNYAPPGNVMTQFAKNVPKKVHKKK
ncbi:glioma pathogenesis-related protein 1-like [Teleopsis dalmanni]|uniref:glioma pathogenesis-related protein 1-like n=1 Tax=Teleopsis dalmanni TaxID=139649 RepID=UPI0018CE9A2C|nr:glioma pathogenesis-related protein 1-like [Teleopsis dalmanni]